jgi:hypothetical protein
VKNRDYELECWEHGCWEHGCVPPPPVRDYRDLKGITTDSLVYGESRVFVPNDGSETEGRIARVAAIPSKNGEPFGFCHPDDLAALRAEANAPPRPKGQIVIDPKTWALLQSVAADSIARGPFQAADYTLRNATEKPSLVAPAPNRKIRRKLKAKAR